MTILEQNLGEDSQGAERGQRANCNCIERTRIFKQKADYDTEKTGTKSIKLEKEDSLSGHEAGNPKNLARDYAAD